MSEAQGGAVNTAAPVTDTTKQAAPKDAKTITGQNPTGTPQKAGEAPQAVSEAAKEAMRKLKLKHDDGTEEEIDEAEALRVYKERKKHQSVASRELNEGKAAKKQAEMLFNLLKDESKVIDVLRKVGHDDSKIRQMSEAFLSNKIKYDLMDPKDRELMEAKQKISEYETLKKKQEESVQQKRDMEMRKKFSEQYTQEFTEALQSTKIPANKHTVAEMAKYISIAAKGKIEMSPMEAAQLVREDIIERQRAVYGDADAEALIQFLGEDTVQKIRAHDVAKIKNPENFLKTPLEQGEVNRQRTNPTKRMSPQEWRQFNRK